MVNVLKFLTFYSILLLPKFLYSNFLKCLEEWQAEQTLIRLLFQQSFGAQNFSILNFRIFGFLTKDIEFIHSPILNI